MGKHYEPSLEEILADRTIQLLMASDGVSEAALRALIGKLRQRQDGAPCAAAASCSTPAL